MDRSCADSPPAASPRPEDTAGKDVAAPPTEPVSDTPAGRAEGAAPVASAPQLPGSVVPEKTDAPDVVTLSVRRPARPAAADGSASPSYKVVNVSPLAFQFTAPSADGNAGRVSPLALQFTAPSTEGAEPEFVDALERIKAAARKHHVALGIFSGNGQAAAERVRQGFQMITVATDISSMIAAATQNLRIARG